MRHECGAVLLPLGPPGGVACGGMLLLDQVDLQLQPHAGCGDDDDDPLSTLFGPSSESSRLRLIGSEESPQTVWAVHGSGCWAIEFPWLPALAKALAGTGDGGISSSEMELVEGALETVPPPVVKELMLVSEGSDGAVVKRLSCAACLRDVFLGDSLIVVDSEVVSTEPRSPSKAWVRCFMRRKLASAVAGQHNTGSSKASNDADGLSSDGRRAILEASIDSIYGELMARQPLVLPKPPGLPSSTYLEEVGSVSVCSCSCVGSPSDTCSLPRSQLHAVRRTPRARSICTTACS